MIIWNPWHGCHKVSEGCQHCYMYFLDRMRGIDTSKVSRNANFDMPLKRGRDGRFKVAPGMELLVGLSTDFFVEEADVWRAIGKWRRLFAGASRPKLPQLDAIFRRRNSTGETPVVPAVSGSRGGESRRQTRLQPYRRTTESSRTGCGRSSRSSSRTARRRLCCRRRGRAACGSGCRRCRCSRAWRR
ncbi:MAG: DUF5131 family protein [Kiritimatiellae bacterium]|nr:DUF5131 family protein [Kiritimatiellia bacterium]